MNKKLHIKKGDMVYVNAGNEKGKTGKVLSVDKNKDRAIVEGLNMEVNTPNQMLRIHKVVSSSKRLVFIFLICRL